MIDGSLSLYEHQFTYNPNLPLRFLIYISQLYSGMTRDKNLYGIKVNNPKLDLEALMLNISGKNSALQKTF